MAFNLARHGEFHDSSRLPEERAAGRLQPFAHREPGFPLYLAAVLILPELGSLTAACLAEPGCEAAGRFRRRAHQLSAVVAAASVAATVVAARVLGAGWPLTAAAGLLALMLVPRDASSLLAAFFLLGHAVFATLAWRRPRIVLGALSGVALGLLVLTKAVFQYWLAGIALVWLWASRRDAVRRRSSLPAFAVLCLAAWCLTLPWMIRNAVRVGHFGTSGRAGEVLAIRAEYGRMTWPELRGAFAYYVPVEAGGLRGRAMRWLEPETFGYARFDRDNPEGFYRRAKNLGGDVAARADAIDPGWRRGGRARQDAAQGRAAAGLMREDWLKHVALTLVFAERGSAIGRIHGYPGVAETWGGRIGDAAHRMRVWALRFSRLFLPALGLLLVLAWKRRDFGPAFLLLPVVHAFGVHAAATHFIPRYALPLTLVFVVVLALAAQEVLDRWRAAPVISTGKPMRSRRDGGRRGRSGWQ